MFKGFKVRLYPNKAQEELIWKHFGACRFIWNYMINMQQSNYKSGIKHMSGYGMSKVITSMKKTVEYSFLNDVSFTSLETICNDLHRRYELFFNGSVGYPRFKRRKDSKLTYPIRSNRFYFKGTHAHIEKLGKVKYKSDYVFKDGRSQKYTDVRLSYINGKYILTFGMECDNQAQQVKLNDYSMGIDLGVKEQAVVAYGDNSVVFHNINKSKKMKDLNKRIVHLQRSISRKYEMSRKHNNGRYVKTRNIRKSEDKLRKLYTKTKNIRSNYIHQTTHYLVSLSPERVVMEDINVHGLLKNRHLSRAIREQCFFTFIHHMRYKCEWNGIEFVQAGRFYPSSKTCSCCGGIKHSLKLSDRTYKCEYCGNTIDRDLNAAINLMRYEA